MLGSEFNALLSIERVPVRYRQKVYTHKNVVKVQVAKIKIVQQAYFYVRKWFLDYVMLQRE